MQNKTSLFAIMFGILLLAGPLSGMHVFASTGNNGDSNNGNPKNGDPNNGDSKNGNNNNDKDKNFPILTGTGAPPNKLGHDGNLYIDNSNHNYYQKDNGKWILKGNLSGPPGAAGPAGAQGPKGDTGAAGANGAQGPKGDKGDKGDTGATGAQGPKGDKGDTGATGAQGTKGDTGAQGTKGDTGAQGTKGDTGAQGTKGDTGAQGPQGPQGAQGPAGPQGPAFSGSHFHLDFGNTEGGAHPSVPCSVTITTSYLNQGGIKTSMINYINGNPVYGQLAYAQVNPFVGGVYLFSFNFMPPGYMHADGTLLPISQNTALFSLLGNSFGGDGLTTFALPDLRCMEPPNMQYGIAIFGIFPPHA